MDLDLMQPHEWRNLIKFLADQKYVLLHQTDVKSITHNPDTGITSVYYEAKVRKVGYAISEQRVVDFIQTEYIAWLVREDEPLNNLPPGGQMANFSNALPAARPTSFRRVGQPVTNIQPPATTQTATKPIKQRGLLAFRRDLTADMAADIQRDGSRLLKRGAVSIDGNSIPRLECTCNSRNDPTCKHREFAYVTGWDRKLLLDPYVSPAPANAIFGIAVPIGLGFAYMSTSIEVETQADGVKTGWLNVSSPAMSRLAEQFTSFPESAGQMRLSPDEGLLRVIRYTEGLIANSDQYNTLLGASEMDGPIAVANACRRTHTGVTAAKVIAGMSYSNAGRTAWILATCFSLVQSRLCLPCKDANTATPVGNDW